MKTNSMGKSFTIEKILKIDFQNFHVSWKASKVHHEHFSVVYTIKLSRNTYFIKCSEKNISQCILAYRVFLKKSKTSTLMRKKICTSIVHAY